MEFNLRQFIQNNKIGFKDFNENIVIKPIYDTAEIIQQKIKVSKNGKVGVIDGEGAITIPIIFDEISLREDGFVDVRVNDSWGVLDTSGKIIVDTKYSKRLPLKWSGEIVKNNMTGLYGILGDDGTEIVSSMYEHLQRNNDFIFFGYNGEDGSEYSTWTFFSNILDGTWGCMNKDGQIIIKAKYDCFKIKDNFILAGRNGEMLYHDNHSNATDYSGVYDLYSSSGELIFGGFSDFQYNKEKKLFIFLLGGEWERFSQCVDEWNGIYIHDYTFNKGIGGWLVLDENLKTIKRNEKGKRYQFKKGSICRINIRWEDNKKIYLYNIPIDSMIDGLVKIEGDSIIFAKNNNNDRKVSSIQISTGKQIPFYDIVEIIEKDFLLYKEEKKIPVVVDNRNLYKIRHYVGIRNYERIILPAEYIFITHPEAGFYFTGEEIDDNNTSVHLRSLYDEELDIVAINSIGTEDLIKEIKFGWFKISLNNSAEDLKRITLPNLKIFDTAFTDLISAEDSRTGLNNRLSQIKEDIYWFSYYYDLIPNIKDPIERYDDNDYGRDRWDALTDGTEGDYPGVDIDYESMGF